MELKTVILEFLGKYQQNEVYNAFKFSLVIVWCTVIIHFVKCLLFISYFITPVRSHYYFFITG